MQVPFGTITVTQEAKELIQQALDSNRLSSGKLVRQFEEKFAELTGTKEAVALSSGTDADALALAMLQDFGARRGQEVIVPALSFVATGNAVLQAGFVPVFVDVRRETLNIDPDRIEDAVTEHTAAIMPVHLMGKPAAMDEINAIASKHDLFVVEDAAEAHGAEYKGKTVGTLGDAAAYSTYVAHIITSIEGGIVTTDREDFAEVLRSLRSHGRACKCKQCVVNTADATCPKRFQYGTDVRFVFERIGYSCKMNEIEAAVGLGSLTVYHEILDKRRANLRTMMQRVRPLAPVITTFVEEDYEQIGPHALPLLVAEDAPFSRDDLVQHLAQARIDTRNLFVSMPTQCTGFEYLGHKLGEFPEAEFVGRQGLHVGCHQDLTDEQIDYFVQTLTTFVLERTGTGKASSAAAEG